MNDADWFKKFQRGKRGGCALWLVLFVGLLAIAASHSPASAIPPVKTVVRQTAHLEMTAP